MPVTFRLASRGRAGELLRRLHIPTESEEEKEAAGEGEREGEEVESLEEATSVDDRLRCGRHTRRPLPVGAA